MTLVKVWVVHKATTDAALIKHGDRVVGSVIRKDKAWHVEIPWNLGNIVGSFDRFVLALAFIEGCRRTLAVITGATADVR